MTQEAQAMKFFEGESLAVSRYKKSKSEVLDLVREALNSIVLQEEDIARGELLYHAVASNDSVDFNSWKCKGGCGCPMTQAGFAIRKALGLDIDSTLFSRSRLSLFPSAFDRRMANLTKHTAGPAIIEFV